MTQRDTDPDDFVARVSKSFFDNLAVGAREKAASLRIDVDDVEELFLSLLQESDAGLAVLSASYVDAQLESAWRASLPQLSNASEELIFDNDGPLSNMSGKIRLAHALGWLRDVDAADLHLMRKIRNRFAHDPKRWTFEEPKIKGWVTGMSPRESAPLDAAVAVMRRDEPQKWIPDPIVLSSRQQFHVRTCMMCLDALLLIRIVPIANAYGVSVQSVFGDRDSGPELLKEIRRRQIRTMLNIVSAGFQVDPGARSE